MVRMVALVLSLGLGTGCGWHVGRAPLPALNVAPIDAVGVEPGLRADLHAAVVARLAALGARDDGPTLRIRVTGWDHEPDAAVPGVASGTVAYVSQGAITWEVTGAPACQGTLSARTTWFDAPQVAIDPTEGRAPAAAALADQLATRIVDAIAATPACRALRVIDAPGAHP